MACCAPVDAYFDLLEEEAPLAGLGGWLPPRACSAARTFAVISSGGAA
jgi:hypothetical protein